jgi:methylated-DNA-[protein]-cysteine S-methyltransferase
MKSIFYYETPIGKIGIAEENSKITNVLFKNSSISHEFKLEETPILIERNKQLQEYFLGKRKSFTLPLNPIGTEFMKNVWSSLCDIPYGETRSYKEIAQIINKDKAYRAVGLSNNKNPIPIFIPCHRLISSNGNLTGYLGGLK